MTPKYFLHLAVANNRDSFLAHASDETASPVWLLRGAVRDDISRRYRRNPSDSVERIILVHRAEIHGEITTLTSFNHPLPDAGQTRNATAVIAVGADAQCKVWLSESDGPYTPDLALRIFGRWVEDDIRAARQGQRAISAQ